MSKECQLLKKISSYNSGFNQKLLEKAINFSKKAHNKQLRASGDPYHTHPIAVADILAELKLDDASIITALLHDTVEDTIVTIGAVEREFGSQIAQLVEGVTKLHKLDYQPETIRQAENFRKLFLAMSKDIRILLVKIADRLHNMRTLSHIKSKMKKVKISQETLEIYSPLTERIGMHQIKDELEDLSFMYINPEVRESIVQRLYFLRDKGKKNIVDKIISDLKELLDNNNCKYDIQGREKKPYSIWLKMKKKNISFEQLSDIMAFRIIVPEIKDCYKILGVIHSKYHNIPNSFKDYISTPKHNGYKSIHTIVIGPGKQKIEIQIRTEEMHQIAEFGIAAHWCYKEGLDFNKSEGNYQWINELLNILDSSVDPTDFINNTRLEIYQDQVFCFSPKGTLIALPQGATPVDFAYAIHSDIGNNCIGAKINGVISPLKTILNNGDQVDIISCPNQKPSEYWEDFVVTGKARSQIRKHIRTNKKDVFLQQGRGDLEKFFLLRKKELLEEKLLELLHIFSKDSVEELFISVGEGMISKADIFKACYPDHKEVIKRNNKLLNIFRYKKKLSLTKNSLEQDHGIKGLIPDMLVSFANCCHALPGDKIVGVVNSGKSIAIHVAKCINLNNDKAQNNNIKLNWKQNKAITSLYISRVRVVMSNNNGVIADLISHIALQNINITYIKIIYKTDTYYELIIDIELYNYQNLQELKAYLRSLKFIFSVNRV
jgi:guanosine-3',5'-bis(diphosphate) 3'-pyrophosphohydrolase